LNVGTYYLTVEGFNSLATGTYTLNVTGGGTSVSGTPVVSGPANLCAGSTGAYSVSGITGATGYNWVISGGTIISGQGTASVSVQWSSVNGIVNVTPTSSCGNGNSSNYSVNITSPPVITVTSSNVTCNGSNNGSIVINPSSSNLVYSINGINYFASNTFANLSPGTYNNISAEISSLPGCRSAVSSVVITQPSALNASSSATSILCNGGTAVVTVGASGGTAPYTGTGNFTVNAGNYAYTVTDANGCSANVSGTVTEPSALNVSSSATSILCNGGTAVVTVGASGGTAPYTGTGNFTVNAGNYSYTVTDANGCSANVSVNVTEPSPLNASISSSNYNGYGVSCNGGNNGIATLTVSGGVTPYSYNWSNSSTSATANNLTAGSYSVIITDANGCTITKSIVITQPSPLVLAMSSNQVVYVGYTPASCATLTSSVSGGVTAYNYSWSNSSTTSTTIACPTVNTTYTLTITDANGCKTSGDVKVCVVNVVCYAGNSNVAKVQICHIPPGNNQNPQTICVDASAVAAHLAHGDALGTCTTVVNCNSSSSRFANSENADVIEDNFNNVSIYPNPAKSFVNIELVFGENSTGTIMVTDVTGRVVYITPQLEAKSGDTITHSINVEEYKSGVYFVNININGKTENKKLIIE